ncbi:MAG TPA: DUF882 domain-containing protein [Kofleriaceae bacterium]|nr:DUF882 domain-containing protein [Kofleriaceae bacterium]
MAGWTAAASPVPLPAQAVATMFAGEVSAPIPVSLYDENDHQKGTVAIWRDGSTDEATSTEIKKLFRCRKTHREHTMKQQTLAMIADIAERYAGKTIEYVSAYRVGRDESATSPHRRATALDFRIRGIQLREIRDYLWKTYAHVGVGWYPEGQYIHIDSRPELNDTSWTFLHGSNHYDPTWASLARRPEQVAASHDHHRPGS